MKVSCHQCNGEGLSIIPLSDCGDKDGILVEEPCYLCNSSGVLYLPEYSKEGQKVICINEECKNFNNPIWCLKWAEEIIGSNNEDITCDGKLINSHILL